jgi:hypothetical protein
MQFYYESNGITVFFTTLNLLVFLLPSYFTTLFLLKGIFIKHNI